MSSPYRRWRKTWPEKWHRPWVRAMAWFELLIVDHGFLRGLYNRPEEVCSGVWRSNQPSPWRIHQLAKRGFHSVISLRGSSADGPWLLEQHACSRSGLELYSLRLKSRRAPSREQLRELIQLLQHTPRPLLVHCKSGADRSGLAAAVSLLLSDEPDFERARAQLSWRYLHSRSARSGILDALIDRYASDYSQEPVSFKCWVEHCYDPQRLQEEFKPRALASWMMDRILRRE